MTDEEIAGGIAASIDWPCRYDLCASDKHMAKYKEKRCCSGCAENHGYVSEDMWRTNLELFVGWRDDTGWWTKIGCLLPRWERGVICNLFACDACIAELSEKDKNIIYDTLQRVDEYGYKATKDN